MADNKKEYLIGLLFETDEAYKQIKNFEAEVGKLDKSTKSYIKSEFEARIKGIKSVARAAQDTGDDTFVTKLAEDVEALKGAMKKLQGLFPDEEWAKGSKTISGAFADMDRQIAGVIDTTGKLDKSIAELRKTFETTFKSNGLADMSKYSEKVLSTMAKLEAKSSKGSTRFLDDLTKKYKELNDLKLPDVSSMGLDDIEAAIDRLEDRWEEYQKNFKGNKRGSEYQLEQGKYFKENLHYIQAYDKLYKKQHGNVGYYGQPAYEDLEKEIDKILQKFKNSIDKLEKDLNADSFAQKLASQLNQIDIRLNVDENSKQQLRDTVNNLVKELNTEPLEKIQVKVDHALDISEQTQATASDQELIAKQIESTKAKLGELREQYAKANRELGRLQKEHEKQPVQTGVVNRLETQIKEQEELLASLSATESSSMNHSVASIIRGLDKVNGVIETKTSEWRNKIVNSFKIDKNEINIPFSITQSADIVYNKLQTFFDENEINIRLNKDVIAEQLKKAVEEGGLPVGTAGGTVAFEPKDMAMAIATGLQAFFTGDFTPVTGEKKKVADPTEPKSKKALYLDPQNAFNQEMAEMFREVVNYALGDSKPSKQVKGFLDNKLVGTDFWNAATDTAELEKLAKASVSELTEVLGFMTDKYGVTLLDEFKGAVGKTKNHLLNNFKSDLNRLIRTNNIKQTTIDEDEKNRARKGLWEDYVKTSKTTSGIGKLMGLSKSDADELKLPESADIEVLINDVRNLANEDGLNAIREQVSAQQRLIAQLKESLTVEKFDQLEQRIVTAKQSLGQAKLAKNAQQIKQFEDELTNLEKLQSEKHGLEQNLRVAQGSLTTLQRRETEALGNYKTYSPVLEQLETLKQARESITNINDGQQKEEFLNALQTFSASVGEVYQDLSRELRKYSWGLDVKGFHNRYNVDGASNVNALLKAIDGDDSRITGYHLYEAPEAIARGQNKLTEDRPDRTDILNKKVEVKEFKTREGIEKELAETEKLLIEARNNKDQARVLTLQTKTARLKEELNQLPHIAKRWQEEDIAKSEFAERAANATAHIASSEQGIYDANKQSLETKQSDLQNAISMRKKSIKAEEKAIADQNADNRKIAGARKRLHNKEQALREADAEYTRREKERVAAQEELAIARANYQNVTSQDYTDRDENERNIALYTEQLKNPRNYENLIGEVIKKRNEYGYYDSISGGIYEYAYRSANSHRETALQNALDTQKTLESRKTATAEARLKVENIQKNIKRFGESSQLAEQLNEAQEALRIAIRDEEDTARKLEAYQQEKEKYENQIKDMIRKIRGRYKKDRTDFERDARADLTKKLDNAQQKKVSYGEDPRVAADERLKQAEANSEAIIQQAKEAAEKRNKAQAELDALQSDALVQQSKNLDEHNNKIQELKDKNKQANEELTKVKKDLKLIENQTPASTQNALDQQTIKVDDLISEANKLEQKVLAAQAEAKKVQTFIDETTKNKDYQRVVAKQVAYNEKESLVMKAHEKNLSRANVIAPILSDVSQYRTSDISKELFTAEEIDKLKQLIVNQNKLKALEQITQSGLKSNQEIADAVHKLINQNEFERKIDEFLLKNPNLTLGDDKNPLVKAFLNADNGFIEDYLSGRSELKQRTSADADRTRTLKELFAQMPKASSQGDLLTWVTGQIQKYASQESDARNKVIGLKDANISEFTPLQNEVDKIKDSTKEGMKQYITSLFGSIDEKIKTIDKGGLSKEQEGLLAKEIGDIFRAIEQTSRNYVKEFKEELLTAEQQALVDGRNDGDKRVIYSKYNRIDKPVETAQSEYKNFHENLKNSERYNSLQTRQAELLRDIANPANKDNLEQLKTQLTAINEELAKYEQLVARGDNANILSIFAGDQEVVNKYQGFISDIINKSQNLDLSQAMGAPEKELDAQYKEINDIYAKRDKFVYDELVKRQKALLNQIKVDVKDGKATGDSVATLNKINAELVELEANKRRIERTSLSGDLYRASEASIKSYKTQITEIIKLEQEIALLKAQGLKFDEKANELGKKRKRLNADMKQAKIDRDNNDAAASPYVYAMKELIELEKAYQTLLQQRYAVRKRMKGIEYQLDDVQNSDNYYTSYQYKNHLNAVKREETAKYMHSDKYQTQREQGKLSALDATFKEAQRSIREIIEKQYVSRGESLDNPAVQAQIDEIVAKRAERVMFILEQTLGKRAEKIDISKIPEGTAFLKEYGGWDGIRNRIASSFEDTDEYQELLEERGNARQKAAKLEIEAINRKADETINLINSESEANQRLLQQRMDRISHADINRMKSNFESVLSDPYKTRNREAMVASLGSAARSAGATKDQRAALERELQNLSTNTIKDVYAWFDRVVPEIFPSGDELKELARQSLIFDAKQHRDARIQSVQAKAEADKWYADSETEKDIRKRMDGALQKHINTAIESIDQEELNQILTSMGATDDDAPIIQNLVGTLKEAMEKYVYNLISNYAQSLEAQGGIINGRDVRQEVIDSLTRQIYGGDVEFEGADGKTYSSHHDGLEQRSQEIEDAIANVERQRRAAMQYGGIKSNEVVDAQALRDQAILLEKLTFEKERQKELTEEIARLEKEGASSAELGRLGTQLDNANENIRRLQMFADQEGVLIDLMHRAAQDENSIKQMTLDEQKLLYEGKKAAAEAELETGDEKTKKYAEERLARYVSILERIDGQIAERDQAERDKHNPIKMLAGAIKDALKGQGGVNIDATGLATEATLAQILAVLTGGQVVTSSQTVQTPRSSAEWSTIKAEAQKAYQKVNTKDKTWTAEEKTAVETAIRGLIDKIRDPKIDEKNKIALQVALKDALSDFSAANKDNKNLKYEATKKGSLYLPYAEMEKYFGLEAGALKALRLTNSQAKNKLGTPEEAVHTESKSVVELGEGGINALAKQDTLSQILEVLNAFKSDGVKVVGKKQTDAKKNEEKPPKKTEAELIKERALRDKDAVLGVAANSNIKKKYMDLVQLLEAATDIGDIRKYAQRVSALGFNIKKESAEWDAKVGNSDRVYQTTNFFGTKRDKVRASMEKLASGKYNPEGKQFTPIDFDGKKLTYKLTDARGNVEKLTMEWSELHKEVVITSDKATNKMDSLANKVELLKEKFADAIQTEVDGEMTTGYLDANNEKLQRFNEQIAKIDAKIVEAEKASKPKDKEKILTDLEVMRKEALRLGTDVEKEINKVKKMYSGTTEMNSATKQYQKLDSEGIFGKQNLESVRRYKEEYDRLMAEHKKFSTAGTLYDEKNQTTLRNLALQVQGLGKSLESAQAKSKDLEQRVLNSGTFNGQSIGQISQVAEGTNIYDQMRAKLEELGATNIKIDMIHQKATGTIRRNNKVVSDLEVSYDELTGSLARYHKQERESLTGIPAFLNGFKKKFNSIMQYLSMTMSIHRIMSEFRKGIQYIKEIDIALTELKKVTDETEETYDKFLQTAAQTGAKLGSTISAVTEATATFAKLGYTIEQASEMAESAIVYKNVGDNIASTEDAANSIISTLKGFGMEASESMAIVDKFNEVGNRFAITSQGIGEALRLSASALNEGKNSLDESIALITAANEVVNDPSSVGTALKTLTLRLRGSKTELEEMGEDVSDMATTTSQLQAKLLALTGGKVDIMLDENTFKNSTQILREMAEAWETMSDIQRASALELMGGKRQANVLSALIQNFDTVEDVIETSANSTGSALRENERWMDSIQGKMNEFQNAQQTMWSNFLGSDVIKGLVEIGTWLIRLIDRIGVLNSAMIAFATISMVRYKMGPLEFFTTLFNSLQKAPTKIKDWAKSFLGISSATSAASRAMQGLTVASFQQSLATVGVTESNQAALLSQMGLTEANAAHVIGQQTLNASTLAAAVNSGTLTAAQATQLASLYGLTGATAGLNAAQVSQALITAGVSREQRVAIIQSLGLGTAIKQLTADEVINTLTTAGMTEADAKAIAVKLGLTATNKGLAASFGALWTAMWPVLLAMAGVALIYGIVKAIDAAVKTTEELTEELNNLKTELRDIQSEMETVNSELETMRDRMAELLAKDQLSFVEQEELERLQKENNELQRRLDLLEAEEKIKQDKVAETFVQTMESYGDKTYKRGGEMNWWQRLWSEDVYAESQNEYIDRLMGEYDKVLKVDSGKLDRSALIDEMDADWYSEKIGAEVQALVDAAEGVDYYAGDNLTDQQKEVNEWLDYVYNTQDKLAIMRGGKNAKTNALNRIFDKDENEVISKTIDEYVEALKKGDASAKDSIYNIINNNAALRDDILATGLSIQDATDYFTSFASEANYATVEGKIKEIDEATKRLKTSLSGLDVKDLDVIKQTLTDKGWVDTEGNLMSDVIAEYFGGEDGGISEKTRAEIERLVKQIYDGKISVQDALKSFELFGVQSVVEIQVAEVKTNFKNVFSDLEEADGLVNTFEELGEAINSTVSALEAFNQAQADVADKGFVSIQTALQLMEYTDDYGSVLEVVDGKLQLVQNAEQNLIQARIDAIKVSAQTSVADAQAAYEKAQLAVQSYRSAMTEEVSAKTIATAWNKMVATAAGIKNVLTNLFSGNSISDLYSSGYNAYLEAATGYETKYDDAGLQALQDALTDADKKLQEAKDNAEIANALTAENIKDINSPSDSSTVDEVKDDRFQQEMDYWENRIAANQSKYEQLQNEIDLLEKKGQKADASFYQEQIKLENERKTLLEGQKSAAQAHLATLEEGSEEWWEVANTLNDIEGKLDDVTASIIDLQDAIGEIDTYKFEEFNTRLDNLTSKLETIRNLLAPDGEEDWFDDEGNWTEDGVAVLGTYIQELETYKQGLDEVKNNLLAFETIGNGAEWDDLTDEQKEAYANQFGIHSEQEYYDKQEELINQQYDYMESISDTEQSITDMYESSIDAVEEYTETLIDGYNDYIDSVKEALDAERDLYDFKKNVQKQAKDIAAIERRIVSLSGSTNAADIAERRKLEAQLYESRESLNDTYYDHAKNAQNEALDAEVSAYEETMNKMVEGMRASLEEATSDMNTFLNNVTIAVSMNADTVLAKYKETNVYLDPALTNPWVNAKNAVGEYGKDATNLMDVWKTGGYFADFKSTASTNLSSPWNTGANAADAFKTSVNSVMDDVVRKIETNVQSASTKLSNLYQQIIDTENKAKTADVDINNLDGDSEDTVPPSNNTEQTINYEPAPVSKSMHHALSTVKDIIIGSQSFLDQNTKTIDGVKYYLQASTGYYYQISDLVKKRYDGGRSTGWAIPAYTSGYAYYAKGTPSTPRDEWAITDEPKFGDELTMYATPEGTLSFMRTGSTVIPADITKNLIEWGQFTPDSFNVGGGINMNMINNAVNKPEFNLSFEALVKAERIDENTLPEVKRYVQQEINTLVKQMNYAIKGRGGR